MRSSRRQGVLSAPRRRPDRWRSIEQDFQGEPRRYYRIQILHNDMTVMVPVDSAEKAGHPAGHRRAHGGGGDRGAPRRPHHDAAELEPRVKHNREKIKTGDVFEMADVVRNLALRDHEKGLSTGEKQMFGKVKQILASELMYAKDMREDDALSLPRRRPRRDLRAYASTIAEGEPMVVRAAAGHGVWWGASLAYVAGRRVTCPRPILDSAASTASAGDRVPWLVGVDRRGASSGTSWARPSPSWGGGSTGPPPWSRASG